MWSDRKWFRTMRLIEGGPVEETDALWTALWRMIIRGNLVALRPRPYSMACPEPKAAGAQSWAVFRRGLRMWVVTASDGLCRIIPHLRRGVRDAYPDPTALIELRRGATAGEVATRVTDVLQARN